MLVLHLWDITHPSPIKSFVKGYEIVINQGKSRRNSLDRVYSKLYSFPDHEVLALVLHHVIRHEMSSTLQNLLFCNYTS